MTKSAIVITVTAALLYTGLPGGPTIDSTTTGVDKLVHIGRHRHSEPGICTAHTRVGVACLASE